MHFFSSILVNYVHVKFGQTKGSIAWYSCNKVMQMPVW